jgi:hypothetical protein
MFAQTKGALDPDTGPSQYTADPGHATMTGPVRVSCANTSSCGTQAILFNYTFSKPFPPT